MRCPSGRRQPRPTALETVQPLALPRAPSHRVVDCGSDCVCRPGFPSGPLIAAEAQDASYLTRVVVLADALGAGSREPPCDHTLSPGHRACRTLLTPRPWHLASPLTAPRIGLT